MKESPLHEVRNREYVKDNLEENDFIIFNLKLAHMKKIDANKDCLGWGNGNPQDFGSSNFGSIPSAIVVTW